MYKFRLYVVGDTPRSAKAIDSLREVLESDLKGQYSLDVTDLLKDPGAGDADGILATPTAIKVYPPPARRILGDFSDRTKVLFRFGLEPGLEKV